jgi:hypothetical protein
MFLIGEAHLHLVSFKPGTFPFTLFLQGKSIFELKFIGIAGYIKSSDNNTCQQKNAVSIYANIDKECIPTTDRK